MTKLLTLVLIIVLLSSCNNQTKPKTKRAFTVCKTDDNNLSTSAIIQCDSVNMISVNCAKYWIDGKSFNLFAKDYIKIMSNDNY